MQGMLWESSVSGATGQVTDERLSWRVSPVIGEARSRWVGELLDSRQRCIALTGFHPCREDVVRVLRRVFRVAHADDCYSRLDNDPNGLQFLLADPAGAVLLIGRPQLTVLERERAIAAVKRSARAVIPQDLARAMARGE
jgi:hypothetical protein